MAQHLFAISQPPGGALEESNSPPAFFILDCGWSMGRYEYNGMNFILRILCYENGPYGNGSYSCGPYPDGCDNYHLIIGVRVYFPTRFFFIMHDFHTRFF